MSTALDTMVLIWAIQHPTHRKKQPDPAVVELRRRAKILLDILSEEGAQIIIPSVVVGELLAGIEEAHHVEFLSTLQNRFFCPPYDVKASAMAARMWIHHQGMPKEDRLERRVLKADVMVIATAKVAGALRFYSHDAKARRLAKAFGLNALDLPTHHPDMHVEAELRDQAGRSGDA
jgi:predicted nucleic acid-binding protein